MPCLVKFVTVWDEKGFRAEFGEDPPPGIDLSCGGHYVLTNNDKTHVTALIIVQPDTMYHEQLSERVMRLIENVEKVSGVEFDVIHILQVMQSIIQGSVQSAKRAN